MSSIVVNAWEDPYGNRAGVSIPSEVAPTPSLKARLAKFLRPLLDLWIRFGGVMGKIMTTIILTLLYFLVVGPLHLYLRVCGRLPLELELDPSAATYWQPVRSANRRDRDRRLY